MGRKCQFVSVQLAPLPICSGRDGMDEITTLHSSLECLAELSGNRSIDGLIQRCMPHRMLQVESVNSASLVILLIQLVTLSFTYSSTYSRDRTQMSLTLNCYIDSCLLKCFFHYNLSIKLGDNPAYLAICIVPKIWTNCS